MGKRGPKPKGKVKIEWSANFAYAIGLIATDGSLSKNGRIIDLTSKDKEQILNFLKCIGIQSKIGLKYSGAHKKYFRVQVGDVLFYHFLESIGLTVKKSKTIGALQIPQKHFFDFLRGSFDGDGCFYSYYDPRWRSSHVFYLTFSSASKIHIHWLQNAINIYQGSKGHISKSVREDSIYSLRYAKKEALEIIKKMYYSPSVVYLSRKKVKIDKALKIEEKQQKVYQK